MGYACPVCSTPQADAEHLANHLAFSAMLGHEDHERWLDEYVPGWEDQGPEDLAPTVAEEAPETDYPQVFEDTTGHDHEESFEAALARQAGQGRDARSAETERVLARAREMTREMLEGSDEDDAGDDEEASSGERTDDEASESTDDPDGDDETGDA